MFFSSQTGEIVYKIKLSSGRTYGKNKALQKQCRGCPEVESQAHSFGEKILERKVGAETDFSGDQRVIIPNGCLSECCPWSISTSRNKGTTPV